MGEKLRARVIIPNKRGLHARASAKIVEASARFQSEIEVVKDGTAVNGSARLVGVFAAVTRRVQTGYLYHYALAMIVGLFALLTWFVAPWSAWLGK